MTTLIIPTDDMVEFLVGLLNTPSPTGYHREGIAYTRAAFEALNFPGLTVTTLPKGTLLLTVKGSASDAPVGVTAHLDTLGLMVKEIKPSGRLKATNIGGIVWGGIEYEGVTVRTHDDQRYRGSVVPVNASAHVNPGIRTQERNADTMEIRLDVKTDSAAETRALGIEVGDFIFVDSRVEVTDTGFIRGRHLDNKAGVAVIYGALLALQEAEQTPTQDTTILIANYEEVGHGGSVGFPPAMVELLTVDMGAVGERQNSDEFSVSLCIKDSGGPYHFDINTKLRAMAAQYHIPLKPDIYPSYSSDGTAYWLAGGAARVGLIGPGVDASHSYERTHRDSLTHTAHLIARYLLAEVDG
jgi:putative aminopeptidase FrvX